MTITTPQHREKMVQIFSSPVVHIDQFFTSFRSDVQNQKLNVIQGRRGSS